MFSSSFFLLLCMQLIFAKCFLPVWSETFDCPKLFPIDMTRMTFLIQNFAFFFSKKMSEKTTPTTPTTPASTPGSVHMRRWVSPKNLNFPSEIIFVPKFAIETQNCLYWPQKHTRCSLEKPWKTDRQAGISNWCSGDSESEYYRSDCQTLQFTVRYAEECDGKLDCHSECSQKLVERSHCSRSSTSASDWKARWAHNSHHSLKSFSDAEQVCSGQHFQELFQVICWLHAILRTPRTFPLDGLIILLTLIILHR